MVAHVGGYYRAEFQFFWGFTQGYPLPPTIFNVVVDAVVRHWILLVEVGEGVQDGCGRYVLHRTAFFYPDDSLVAYTDPDWMHRVFETLTGLFNRLGIRKLLGRQSRCSSDPAVMLGTSRRRLTGGG